MEKFDIFKMTDELKNEIAACNTVEELKALFVSKDYYVPDNKLEAIMKLKAGIKELDVDELEIVSGGGCGSCGEYCGDCGEACWQYCPHYNDRKGPQT